MAREIWVAGYPSFVGGADTELDHMIDLWRAHDVAVHLVPTCPPDPAMKQLCDDRGCRTHDYRDDIFRDKLVISFCNGELLKRLPQIARAGRPRTVLWANCMTWNFDDELQAHEQGLIDLYLFQSDYQRRMLLPKLEERGAVRVLEGYRPYFNLESRSQRLNFRSAPPEEYFGVGRVSRDDPQKFAAETWMTFAKVSAPRPIKVFMLGFGEQAQKKCGSVPPCNWLDWMYWTPGAIPVHEFFQKIHVLIHRTGGSRENWPRIVLEAWASGVPVIVDNDYGVAEMVRDGETGFCVSSSDEASFRASQLAFDEPLRQRIAQNAYQALVDDHANPSRSLAAFQALLEPRG